MTRTLLLAAIGLTALIVNPFFGCETGTKREFTYGAPEMRAAIEGTWKLRVPGKPEVTLEITQAAAAEQHAARASLVRTAEACEQRSFVRTAGACLDESDMGIDVKVAGMTTKSPPQGTLRVFGFEFRMAELTLHFDEFSLSAMITPRGTVESATVGGSNVGLVKIR